MCAKFGAFIPQEVKKWRGHVPPAPPSQIVPMVMVKEPNVKASFIFFYWYISKGSLQAAVECSTSNSLRAFSTIHSHYALM